MPDVSNQVTETMKQMIEFFNGELILDFVASMAKLQAHYYKTLVIEGVPAEAAATIAASYKGPADSIN